MKRDRDRIRRLLLDLEASDHGILIVGGTDDSDEDEIADEYHLRLMQDEGLAVPTGVGAWRLTAVGHDAVEALEQNEFWAKLKKAGPGEAYDLLKGTTSSIALQALSRLMGWG